MREVVILYFSGTGNTKYISEQIGEAFQRLNYHVDLISVEDGEALLKLNIEEKLIGIGFPCYALSYPNIINQAIRKLPSSIKAVPAFIFATKGWSTGNSLKELARFIHSKNLYPIQTASFVCPNNGWITLFSREFVLCRNMGYPKTLSTEIDGFAVNIINPMKRFEREPFSIGTYGNPLVTPVTRLLKVMEGRVLRNYRVERERCISCGLCIKNCPDRNIRFDDDRRVIFQNPDHCTGCLRCINDCPKDAIRLGGLITGKGWYTKELQAEYIKKATENRGIG